MLSCFKGHDFIRKKFISSQMYNELFPVPETGASSPEAT